MRYFLTNDIGGAVIRSGVYASFAGATAAMCRVGTRVQPDPHAAPRYRAECATRRQLAERPDKLTVQA